MDRRQPLSNPGVVLFWGRPWGYFRVARDSGVDLSVGRRPCRSQLSGLQVHEVEQVGELRVGAQDPAHPAISHFS
jgi:hypothetical protein